MIRQALSSFLPLLPSHASPSTFPVSPAPSPGLPHSPPVLGHRHHGAHGLHDPSVGAAGEVGQSRLQRRDEEAGAVEVPLHLRCAQERWSPAHLATDLLISARAQRSVFPGLRPI